MRRGVRALGLLLLTFPGVAARAGAQGERGGAVITGTVTDRQSDSGVDGAVVLLRGTLLHSRTTERGRFRLTGVPPGTYTLTVLAFGYTSDSLRDLTVAEGETREVAFALAPAPVGLTDVVVTASRSPERGEESGASVSVLSHQGLTRRNVTTLDQALVYEPGVTVNAG